MKGYISPFSAAALLISAALLPFLGALPQLLMSPIGQRSVAFFGQEALHHSIAYFSGENLLGAAESIGIGAVVYFAIVRPLLMKNENGIRVYVNRWPAWLDLENGIYRPILLKLLPGVLGAVTRFIAGIPESLAVMKVIPGMIVAAVRFVGELPERLALFLRGTVFRKRQKKQPVPVGNRFTYTCGQVLNACARGLNATICRQKPVRTDFEFVLDASWQELTRGTHRITASISFGLLLMCIGLLLTCLYLLN